MTSNDAHNPWSKLPTVSPYILPTDKPNIDVHRHANSELRLDTLPEPFVGGLNHAEVIFLALNPGFRESDVTVNMASREFIKANRHNQSDPYTSPFYYFSGGLEETGGYWWWKKQLKPLIQAGVTEDMIRDKIMLIEYLPYHSENASKIGNLNVPSQAFSFGLVREAIQRKKLIVMMRSPKLWLEAVPELESNYIAPHSWLNVMISPRNMGEANFNAILKKLTS
jgi:hypothetical protein